MTTDLDYRNFKVAFEMQAPDITAHIKFGDAEVHTITRQANLSGLITDTKKWIDDYILMLPPALSYKQ